MHDMRRCSISALLLLLSCTGNSTAPSPGAKVAASPGTNPTVCEQLAAEICDTAPIECAPLERLLTKAGSDAQACTSARKSLEELAKLLEQDQIERGVQVLLVDLLRDKATPDELRSLTDPERGVIAYDVPSDLEGFETQRVSCPGTAALSGRPPPAGTEAWCQAADGMRHGPAVLWNAAHEVARISSYRHGRLVRVVYEFGAGEADFVCPDGTSLRNEIESGDRTLWCAAVDGERTGGSITFGRDGSKTLQDGNFVRMIAGASERSVAEP